TGRGARTRWSRTKAVSPTSRSPRRSGSDPAPGRACRRPVPTAARRARTSGTSQPTGPPAGAVGDAGRQRRQQGGAGGVALLLLLAVAVALLGAGRVVGGQDLLGEDGDRLGPGERLGL